MPISKKFQNNSDLDSGEVERNLEKGQHFLKDKEIIEKEIAVADLSKKDRVIEIGAGEGNLTEKLVKKSGKVLAFEIDERYSEKLKKLKENYDNLEIIYDNALNYSWRDYSKIVSNIPYFLSEQLIKKSIEDGILEIVVIVGEKFGEILEKKESKIGVISNLFYEIDFIQKINKSCFLPPPRTNSWLIKLRRKEKLSSKEAFLASILGKKSKIKNALLYSLVERGKTKREARKIIEKKGFSKQVLEKPVSRITGRFLIKLAENFEKLD
ncbi:hypothetical protein FJZ20_01105 [Candidatus Pacearchaeota archaeon]|nr:hypothetical protein [Candidatus Pacearchaeota archaeon]